MNPQADCPSANGLEVRFADLDAFGVCFLVDESGCIQHWSRDAHAFYGFSSAEVTRERFEHRFPLPISGEVAAHRTKDGSVRIVRVRALPMSGGHRLMAIEDHTVRYEVQQKLDQRSDQMRRMIHNMGEGFVVLNPEGKITCFNPSAGHLLSTIPEEAIGKDAGYLQDLLGVGSMALFSEANSASAVLTADRTGLLMDVRARRVPEGMVVYISPAGAGTAEAVFRDLFEASPDAQLLLSDNIVVECNNAAVRLLGLQSKSQLLGRAAPSFAPEVQWDGTLSAERRKLIDQELDSTGAYHGEWTFLSFCGDPVAVQIAVSRVRIGGKLLDHAIWHDLSDRKAAESKAQDLENRYRAIVENSTDIIYLLSPSGKFRFVSPSFLRLFGYEEGDIMGLPLSGFVHPEDLPHLRKQWVRAVQEDHAPEHFEYRVRAKDGGYRHLSTNTAVQSEADGGFSIIGSAQDVTERVRVAHELEVARDTALASSRAKSEFLATVSHEVRTPLNGILGASELLLDAITTSDERDLVEVIHSSGESLLRIIDDILEISKAQAGRLALVESPTDLRKLIQEVASILQPRADEIGLDLNVQWRGPLELRALVDGPRLKQVIGNLLGNALKFTYAGHVTITGKVRESTFRVEVEDSGIGIAPNQIESIFLPFQQADGGIQRLFGGTGLGLSICRELVLTMKGQIGVESQPGKGSRFWFEIPVQFVSGSETAAAVVPMRTTGARILVVEDHEVNRMVVTRMLHHLGCITALAPSGEDALRMVDEDRYDLVLMDVQMPGIDGLETTRRMRRKNGLAKLPIVALTANAFHEDRAACLSAGMDDFLAKPIRRQDLAQAIERALGNRTD